MKNDEIVTRNNHMLENLDNDIETINYFVNKSSFLLYSYPAIILYLQLHSPSSLKYIFSSSILSNTFLIPLTVFCVLFEIRFI